jgi:hypothetical protein
MALPLTSLRLTPEDTKAISDSKEGLGVSDTEVHRIALSLLADEVGKAKRRGDEARLEKLRARLARRPLPRAPRAERTAR